MFFSISRSRSRFLFLAALLLPITAAFASDSAKATPDKQQAPKIDQAQALKNIEQEIDANRKQLFVPGASLAIIKDDKVILLTGLGYKDLANKKPVTPNTLFAIGSCTKAFTSMLMAMAVDEGKVKWDDSPKKYLPYFRMFDPDADAKITINDVLSHRSGLPRTDFILLGTDLTPEDMIWNITRAKPTAKLGEKWQYQNIMFVAAGEIEHAVYGKPWQQLVKERIFDPLGMKRSNTSVPQMLQDPDHSLGYDGSPPMKELPMRSLDAPAPAGAINSSASDMALWVRYLLRGGTVNANDRSAGSSRGGAGGTEYAEGIPKGVALAASTVTSASSANSAPPRETSAQHESGTAESGDRLVSQVNFDEIFKPHQAILGNMKYGYGWVIDDWHGHKIIQHGGNIGGFNAQVAMMPDQNLGLVLLTNVSGSPLGGIAMESVWKNLVGLPADAEQIVALKDPDQEVGKYRIDSIKLDLDVTHEGNKLFVKPAGQPKMELLPLGNRKYKIGAPAPDHVYMTFGPDKDDAKKTQVELEQAGMKFVAKQPAPYQPPMTGEELIAKELQAMGGAENWSKIKTLSYRYVFDMETQGIRATGLMQKQAPDLSGEVTVYSTDSGRSMAWDQTSFDGERASINSSYSPSQMLSGVGMQAVADLGAISQEMYWRKLFESVAITGEDKVDGEDVYLLTKKGKGVTIVDSVSKKDFRLLKRVYGVGENQVTDIYKEYQTLAGVQIPVTIRRDGVTSGPGTVTITDVQVNQPVDAALFRVKG